MLQSKWVTGFVFSALFLLSPSFRPEPAVAEILDAGASARRITVDASSLPAVSIQQAVEKAVPPAVPVQQDDPSDDTAPVTVVPAAAPKHADRPAEAKAPDTPKTAPLKPAPAAAIEIPSPAEFLEAEDTTFLPNGNPAAAQLAPIPAPVLEVDDVMKVKPESSDLFGPIEKNINYFSNSIKKHFTRYLFRSGKYVDMMKSILRENYLPEDLVFLALIESGFNPKAYSWAKASGPWQFIKGTATRYGLRIDRWVDERRDPIKSTHAAAAYLKDLYEMFGSWPLAMASYNCGEGRIARAVRGNDTEDFWELRKTRSIPSETKEYVPRFVAAQMIASNPEKYGFNDVQYDSPFEFDEVKISHSMDLKVAAKCAEATETEIKELNPELLRSCTPPNRKEYALRIPKGTKDTFEKNYAALPDGQKIAKVVRHYVIRRGDTLSSIARRFDLSTAELAKANRMRVSSLIRVGRTLRIPSNGVVVATTSSSGGNEKEAKAEAREKASSAGSRAAAYRVKRGDTLYRIARRHGMSVKELARLNGISAKSRVKIGQRLALSKATTGEKVATAKKSPGKKYASKKTYKVKRGDTLISIARKFNISREKLAKANSISGSSIQKGQRLVIPDEEEA